MTKQNKNMTTGEMIKHIRTVAGLSQKELGRKIGRADTTISSYEREEKNPSVKTLLKIANICDFGIKVILTDNDSEETFNLVTKKK